MQPTLLARSISSVAIDA
uniref:Uncharacterized protein n=1 Tax=Anopheles albimanus TaxID=7167 RepID=A0A182FYZ2_ANOAL